MSTEALFWALRDGTLALCYGNLEQVQADTFQAKRYPALGEEITTPVLQIGLEDERPESVKLEPVEWDSGKSGWRGFSRTRWGKLRVNLTLIEQKDGGFIYGVDVLLEGNSQPVEASEVLPGLWLEEQHGAA